MLYCVLFIQNLSLFSHGKVIFVFMTNNPVMFSTRSRMTVHTKVAYSSWPFTSPPITPSNHQRWVFRIMFFINFSRLYQNPYCFHVWFCREAPWVHYDFHSMTITFIHSDIAACSFTQIIQIFNFHIVMRLKWRYYLVQSLIRSGIGYLLNIRHPRPLFTSYITKITKESVNLFCLLICCLVYYHVCSLSGKCVAPKVVENTIRNTISVHVSWQKCSLDICRTVPLAMPHVMVYQYPKEATYQNRETDS